MSLPVAILAGGLATRLGAAAADRPKALVDVGGRPFAEHQIELLRRHGIRHIVFLVSHLGEMVRAALGSGERWDVTLRYVFDGPRSLGTGGAVRKALPELGPAFFVLYGDSYLECDYGDVARAFAESGAEGLMTVCRNEDRWDRSNVHFENGRILAYDKRTQTADMRHIDYGLGVFTRAAFSQVAADVPFDLADLYQRLLAAGALAAYEVPGRFYEIGSPAGLAETRAHLSEGGR
jgi:N-acetyl-alpha-D-muramate 1-phosphate uridylyltransferase